MTLRPLCKWKCHQCDELHTFEDDALACCRPNVSVGYVCPTCEDWHSIEVAAVACCADELANEAQSGAAQLEAAGQLRLAL